VRVSAGCVVSTGEAWVMAIRQASIIIVRGDGEGKGEEGPGRRIV
jgi:hypothetical protein